MCELHALLQLPLLGFYHSFSGVAHSLQVASRSERQLVLHCCGWHVARLGISGRCELLEPSAAQRRSF